MDAASSKAKSLPTTVQGVVGSTLGPAFRAKTPQGKRGCRRKAPPPSVADWQTLISIQGDRPQIEWRSRSPTQETDIAQREPPGCLPNQCPLLRPSDFPT